MCAAAAVQQRELATREGCAPASSNRGRVPEVLTPVERPAKLFSLSSCIFLWPMGEIPSYSCSYLTPRQGANRKANLRDCRSPFTAIRLAKKVYNARTDSAGGGDVPMFIY